MAIAPGTQLGTYTILTSLGAGGMGQVYRAQDSRLQREVAIKLLHDDLIEDPEQLARFKREARLLASVNHPNIATIFSLEEQGELRFLVMELVPGDTLAERLAPGPLAPAEVVRIGRQVAEALEAAHEQGIVHRDLKPENIKITPRGLVKVLDFGLAKNVAAAKVVVSSEGASVIDQPTPAGVLLGTPAYMSPEQARGLAVDHRADVWALGCILYEALSGRKPFGGPTVCDTLVAILEREPDWSALPSALPDRLRDLLRHCLTKDPEQRLSSFGEACRDLEEAARSFSGSSPALDLVPIYSAITTAPTIDRGQVPAGLTTTLPPTSMETIPVRALPARTKRSHKGLIIGACAGGGVVLLGLGLWLWLSGVLNPNSSSQEQQIPNIRMSFTPTGISVSGVPDASGRPGGGMTIDFSQMPGMNGQSFPMPNNMNGKQFGPVMPQGWGP